MYWNVQNLLIYRDKYNYIYIPLFLKVYFTKRSIDNLQPVPQTSVLHESSYRSFPLYFFSTAMSLVSMHLMPTDQMISWSCALVYLKLFHIPICSKSNNFNSALYVIWKTRTNRELVIDWKNYVVIMMHSWIPEVC